jgi:phosphatidylserine decarboxylase
MRLAFEFAAKEIVIGVVIIILFFLVPALLVKTALLRGFFFACFLLLLVLWLNFFQHPKRDIVQNSKHFLSPADGKVVEVSEIFEDNFLKKKVVKIGIFMSPFNCHINRIPLGGRVVNLKYTEGGKLPAYSKNATSLNENMVIHFKNENVEFLVKQIAGIFARRIKNNLKVGQEVLQGEPFGMILIGSKVEVFFPSENVEKILVKTNDKIKAGETILIVIK